MNFHMESIYDCETLHTKYSRIVSSETMMSSELNELRQTRVFTKISLKNVDNTSE